MEMFFNHLSDNIYYQDIDSMIFQKEYADFISTKLLSKYSISRFGIYTHCVNQEQNLPIQGWKIHISSNIQNAVEILKIVAQMANEVGFSFKFMTSEQILWFSTQKNYSRLQSGKFITIYTKDDKEFKVVIEKLYKKLRLFEGSFVLTDKRYKDCKVLYYRFGGFDTIYGINGNEGKLGVLSPNGLFIEDKRVAQYVQPSFVEDPFPEFDSSDEGVSYLFSTYYEIEALRFSNSGGVYTGLNQDEIKVILKESRPQTCISISDSQDSIDRRKQEAEFLCLFSDVKQFPKLYDSFYEWEHYFIVEEYIDGKTLKEFSAEFNPFLNQDNKNDKEKISQYVVNILHILSEIREVLDIVHSRGYVIGDLSLENIMLNDDGIKFVDLESVFHEDAVPKDILLTFPANHANRNDLFSIDFEMMGNILYDLIFPKSVMKIFGEEYLEKYLLNIVEDFNINQNILELWKLLIHYDNCPNISKIDQLIDAIQVNPIEELQNQQLPFSVRKQIVVHSEELVKLMEEVILGRKNIFGNSSKILSLGTGLPGVLMYLNIVLDSKMISKYEEWLMSKYLRMDKGSISLLEGDVGIALILLKNRPEFSNEIMKLLGHNIKLENIKDFSLSNGLAGYGIVLLKMWQHFQSESYLQQAKTIGNQLLDHSDLILNERKISLADGQVGIALYLLYLFVATKEEKYLKFGETIIDEVLKCATSVNGSIGIPEYRNDNVILPYLGSGVAGLISVLLRYYLITKNESYRLEINRFTPALNIKYSVSPGLLDGLAGVGHTLLDLYTHFKDDIYEDMLYSLQEGIDLQMIERQGIHFFPNLKMEKLDCSLNFGSSGILSFINRLNSGQGENPFFFCDSLILVE
ncbi:class III lanthionine synthetase LanKC N-terminal domain-containing protein [Streptococcus marmotae]|uniref:class III lanthionine synthetase LanKC N-terminal domain-containing protein n=1 Tax=Streptococcus marmotae TaxID=1825069 RepID=UPI000830480E|nr:lanthionine synthetase LanC family protein [Streptococcus marmotae]